MANLNDLLSKTRPYFARYEGSDSKGRAAYIEFELGHTDGWLYRYGVLGFPPTAEVPIGLEDSDVVAKIVSVIERGYRLVADDGTMPNNAGAKQMVGFTDWLRTRV